MALTQKSSNSYASPTNSVKLSLLLTLELDLPTQTPLLNSETKPENSLPASDGGLTETQQNENASVSADVTTYITESPSPNLEDASAGIKTPHDRGSSVGISATSNMEFPNVTKTNDAVEMDDSTTIARGINALETGASETVVDSPDTNVFETNTLETDASVTNVPENGVTISTLDDR